jgi:hypothetical protein
MESKVATCAVEVYGLGPKALARLTEAGAHPLKNGAKVQLPIDVARDVVERDPAHFRIIGIGSAGIAPESVKTESADFRYKILSQGGDPVATEDAEATKEKQPANKSMAGKVQTKA